MSAIIPTLALTSDSHEKRSAAHHHQKLLSKANRTYAVSKIDGFADPILEIFSMSFSDFNIPQTLAKARVSKKWYNSMNTEDFFIDAVYQKLGTVTKTISFKIKARDLPKNFILMLRLVEFKFATVRPPTATKPIILPTDLEEHLLNRVALLDERGLIPPISRVPDLRLPAPLLPFQAHTARRIAHIHPHPS